PWRIKEDMLRFKNLTLNHPVIMGRKTYESIPEKFRPLPDRKNIILSKTLGDQNGIYIAKNIDEALNFTEKKDSYIIGGEEIYKMFLPLSNKIELTRVHKNYEGDVFFPEVNWDEWNLINDSGKLSTDKDTEYSFLTYEKIR
ncbi:MAG: dihydrofolate reductase, partial [Nanoarchaeota archaeon]